MSENNQNEFLKDFLFHPKTTCNGDGNEFDINFHAKYKDIGYDFTISGVGRETVDENRALNIRFQELSAVEQGKYAGLCSFDEFSRHMFEFAGEGFPINKEELIQGLKAWAIQFGGYEEAEPVAKQTLKRVWLDTEPMHRILSALIGAPHEIRELQVLANSEAFPDSPIRKIILQFNAQIEGHETSTELEDKVSKLMTLGEIVKPMPSIDIDNSPLESDDLLISEGYVQGWNALYKTLVNAGLIKESENDTGGKG